VSAHAVQTDETLPRGLDRLRTFIPSRFFMDRGDLRRTLLVVGSGRSGTTWVHEIINWRHRRRLMFEPFDARRVPLLAGWHYYQYIRPGCRDPAFVGPAERILSGRIRHPWIDQFNRRMLASSRLIKDIRLHLALGWIHSLWPEIRIVLLLRHPCAVAHSSLAVGWDADLGIFLRQEELMADFLAPFRERLESAADVFDRHVLTWCVANYVPLCQFAAGGLHVVFYEDLCLQPLPAARALLTAVGEPFRASALARMLRRPSAVSRRASAVHTGESPVHAWRRHVSAEQTRRALERLRAFGLDRVYGEDSAPLVRGDQCAGLFAGRG
jgi:hypothetical protein